MYVYLRLFKTLILDLFRPRIGMFETAVTKMRVWPNDLDMNLHMNNGRYLTLMDIGRFDLSWRTGLLQLALRRGWLPVIGSAHIMFRRSLKPFQKFALHTRMIWWDEKWFFIEQKFMVGDQLYCRALVRGIFRSKGRNIPIASIIQGLGTEEYYPEQPDLVRQWLALEASMGALESIAPVPTGL